MMDVSVVQKPFAQPQRPNSMDIQLMRESISYALLVVLMGALWGSFGTEFATGFIQAQLASMEGETESW